MSTEPDFRIYPRVLCLAPAYAPADSAVLERPVAPVDAAAPVAAVAPGDAVAAAAPVTPVAPGDGRPRAEQAVGTRVDRLLRRLDAEGVRQVVVCPRPRGAPRRERVGERALLRRVGAPPVPTVPVFALAAAGSLLRLARTADVLHLHHAGEIAALPLAVSVARVWDIPLIITLYETESGEMPDEDVRARARRGIGRALERAAALRAAAVITPDPVLAQRLAAEGLPPNRIHVLPPDLPDAEAALHLLDIYRAVWARHLARRVAIWHPMPR